MPRRLKKSRSKGLPPKIQTQIKDSTLGAYPTKTRITSDNRNGKYRTFFDDTNPLIFGSYYTNNAQGGISMPSGLPSGSKYINNSELTSSIFIDGQLSKGIGDNFATFRQTEPEFKPFRDDGYPAVDVKNTVNSESLGYQFYSKGSNFDMIGEGFSQPLWSKTKIEIDLTPISHSFYIENNTSTLNNFPMAYWNKNTRKFEGIGTGKQFEAYITGTLENCKKLLDEQCLGWGPSMDNGGVSVRDAIAGQPISIFGFPYHAKFHGTSSNLIAMSDYISSPFMLEKIVLEFSGSLLLNTAFSGGNKTITTFFILNQRERFKYEDPGFQEISIIDNTDTPITFTTGAFIPGVFNGIERNSSRDIVSWLQISAMNADNERILRSCTRDFNFNSSITWDSNIVLSGSAKSPIPNQNMPELEWTTEDSSVFCYIKTQLKNSTRNGLPQSSGRDFLNSLQNGQIVETQTLTYQYDLLKEQSKINPYILQPGDNLIFGWQLPYAPTLNENGSSIFTYDGRGPELTFAPKPSKITFYGSMISEGKEYHDTLNQDLTSIAIHEVIE